jgi:hypothetical protein
MMMKKENERDSYECKPTDLTESMLSAQDYKQTHGIRSTLHAI